MANNMKQVLLKKKIEGVIYDLYVKTSAALVQYDENTTVAAKVAAVEAVANKAKDDLATLMGSEGSKSIASMIDEKVDALKTALTNEADATSLAGKIKANATAVAAAQKAVSDEATRAKAAEKTLTDNLGALTTKVGSIPTSGTGANSASVVAYAAALAADAKKAATDEATRAQAAESALTTKVNARARFLVSASEPADLTESDVWAQIIE